MVGEFSTLYKLTTKQRDVIESMSLWSYTTITFLSCSTLNIQTRWYQCCIKMIKPKMIKYDKIEKRWQMILKLQKMSKLQKSQSCKDIKAPQFRDYCIITTYKSVGIVNLLKYLQVYPLRWQDLAQPQMMNITFTSGLKNLRSMTLHHIKQLITG